MSIAALRESAEPQPEDALPAPAQAWEDRHSFEMLRLWLSPHGQYASVANMGEGDPARWGVLISNVIDAIAQGAEAQTGACADTTRAQILDAFDAYRLHEGRIRSLETAN